MARGTVVEGQSCGPYGGATGPDGPGRWGPLLASPAVKDIGLVGVPFSGKSTLFTALTRAGSHGGQANMAVVPVPDPRLQVLTDMERSKKTVAAQVRFVDVPGGVSSAQGIAKLREVDALAVVCGASAGTLRRPTSSRTCEANCCSPTSA